MSPQVSRTFLSILVDLNNAVVWIVSTRPHISKLSSSFINSLVTVSRVPITIGITITFMFQFFLFPSKLVVFILFFFLFNFILWSAGTAKSTIWQVIFFCWLLLLFYSLEFFTSALADGFSLKSEWQQVSSSLQDSSQYFGCSQ